MSCCFNHQHGTTTITSVKVTSSVANNQGGQIQEAKVKGNINFTPKTYGDQFFRYLQWTELAEKVCEVVDELFHLLNTRLKNICTEPLYETFRGLHHGAHHIEHLLHSTCFFSDITRIYFQLTEKKPQKGDAETKHSHHQHPNRFFDKDYSWSHPKNLARISHAVSHLLATMEFLSSNALIKFGRLEKGLKLSGAFDAVGYFLATITLFQERTKHFYSDLGIHLGGFLFTAIPLLNSSFSPLNKFASFAGVIHAGCCVKRLLPRDEEKIKGTYRFNQVALASTSH